MGFRSEKYAKIEPEEKTPHNLFQGFRQKNMLHFFTEFNFDEFSTAKFENCIARNIIKKKIVNRNRLILFYFYFARSFLKPEKLPEVRSLCVKNKFILFIKKIIKTFSLILLFY